MLRIKIPKDDDRQTPFHIAAELGHFDMCQIFIAFVIIIMDWPLKNPIFNSGLTPYHLAAESGYMPIWLYFN